MKSKGKQLKILGLVATVIGFGVNLMSDWIDEAKLDDKIDKKLDEKLNGIDSKEEEES
jgi:hypothetical protein